MRMAAALASVAVLAGLQVNAAQATNVPSASTPRPASGWEPSTEHDCLEPAPAAAGVAGVTDDGTNVTLDVLVLIDRMDGRFRAQHLMTQAGKAFAPLGIDLKASFQRVELSGTDSRGLLEQARAAARHLPLEGIDLVHVLTSVDLTLGDNRSVAGQAYCIGGVRFKTDLQAVSISEAWYPYEVVRRGLPQAHVVVFKDGSALIAAHEIGHLLGAHHHYGNCVENASAAALLERREVAPCTVMDQTLFYSSLRFGQVEAAVVRGHAFSYARP
jgi:hypothetical protein